jgi:hypothetical protein
MDTAKRLISTLDADRPFLFSQAALQDYQDCRRRFQLRYLLQAAWPAPQAEPVREHERQIRRGVRFHKLAQQALSGVPVEQLTAIASADSDDHLAQWWDNFLHLLPQLSSENRFVETMLSAPLGRHRLVAKYDLVFLHAGPKLVIYDWKTGLERPKRTWLEDRWQTRIYPYLVVRAAAGLLTKLDIQPEQVEMVYWFAAHPGSPEHISYSRAQFERDDRDLNYIVQEIAGLPAGGFELTHDERRCRFCVYRSYCDRGSSAGLAQESDEDFELDDDIDINFDQIAEISF